MAHHFFAMLYRMKYINRWGLMKNARAENISEHSLDTAFIAHALALIGNKYFEKSYDPEKAALAALFHDCTEIITGDLPTPVKYHSADIKNAYKEIEKEAAERLLSLLPNELKDEYSSLFYLNDDNDCKKLVKAADKISALAKCTEEKKSGNTEFKEAEKTLSLTINKLNMPEVDYFMDKFFPSFFLTLDEIGLSSSL